MSEMNFYYEREFVKFLIDSLGFDEDDAEDWYDNLFEQEEESYKRDTMCSGMLYNPSKGVYYNLNYVSNYDDGCRDFILETTSKKKVTKQVVTTVNEYVEVKE